MSRKVTIAFLFISCLFWVGCSEYWWTRGQPPATKSLVVRSQERLADARLRDPFSRKDLSQLSSQLEESLLGITSALSDADQKNPGQADLATIDQLLTQVVADFMTLEDSVSIGSRAALSELSGQLRTFVNAVSRQQPPAPHTFNLFAARTLFFLANELQVPAPA